MQGGYLPSPSVGLADWLGWICAGTFREFSAQGKNLKAFLWRPGCGVGRVGLSLSFMKVLHFDVTTATFRRSGRRLQHHELFGK